MATEWICLGMAGSVSSRHPSDSMPSIVRRGGVRHGCKRTMAANLQQIAELTRSGAER